MNKFAFALIASAAVAQLPTCETSDECAGVTDGCCMAWTVVSTAPAEEATWGYFSAIWGGEENIVPGAAFQSCAWPTYMDAHFAENPDGLTNNYSDLGNFLEYVPGAREALTLAEDATLEDWLAAWEGDAWTQEQFAQAFVV